MITVNPGFSKKSGFTLIELVMVMVIVGILSVSVMPKLFNVLSFTANTYFDEVLNSIRYAQKVAIGMGCEVEVSTTATSVTLQLRANCQTGAFTQAIQDPASRQSGYTKQAPNNVTIASTDMPIYFDRLGRAHASGGAISNASLTVNSRTISIVGETGYTYAP